MWIIQLFKQVYYTLEGSGRIDNIMEKNMFQGFPALMTAYVTY